MKNVEFPEGVGGCDSGDDNHASGHRSSINSQNKK